MLNFNTKNLLLSLFLSCSSLLQAQLDIYVFGDAVSDQVYNSLRVRFTAHNFTRGNTTAPNRNDLTVPALRDYDLVIFLGLDERFGDQIPVETITALLAYINAGGFVCSNLEKPNFDSLGGGSSFWGINHLWNTKLQGQLQHPVFNLRGIQDLGIPSTPSPADRISFTAPPLSEKNYLQHGKYTYHAAQLALRTFVLESSDLRTGVQEALGSEPTVPSAAALLGVNCEPEMHPMTVLFFGPKQFLSKTAGARYLQSDADVVGGGFPRSCNGFCAIKNCIHLMETNTDSSDHTQPMKFGEINTKII